MNNNQKKVLKKIVGVLSKNHVKFQISGGLAAIFYGGKRPLYDIDIEVYKKDIPKIRKVFKKYIIKDFYNFKDKNFNIWLITLKINNISINISPVERCFLGKVGKKKVLINASNLSKTKIIYLDGIKIPVIKKKELINYKKILSRKTDIIDIKQISKK